MSEILLYENQGISWEIDTYNAQDDILRSFLSVSLHLDYI